MNSRLTEFLSARTSEIYPEPRNEGHDHITATMAALVSERLRPGARILDVGCGQGPALQWFTKAQHLPIGISLCKDDLTQCRDIGLHVAEADMHDLPLWATNFDCVWARHVLEHSPIPFFVLCEFARALKPGGILYVEVPAPDTACEHDSSNPNHYSVLGVKMWVSLIHRAGFGEIDYRAISIVTPAGPDKYFSFITARL